MNKKRAEYIERITRWLMPDRTDPDLAKEARESVSLDGIYSGKSSRIFRIMRLSYLRGVRRGASVAWSAAQPVELRNGPAETCPCGSKMDSTCTACGTRYCETCHGSWCSPCTVDFLRHKNG